MSEPKEILIAGAGVAGPAVALLLTKAGHKCTIVETAPDFRSSGQQIDVDGEGLKVLKVMGIYDSVRDCRVEDDGIKFVTAEDKPVAVFPVESSAGLVKELEIMRPEIARILYDHSKDKAEYIFGDHIASMQQHEAGVTVTLANSKEKKDYDLVIAADGLRSKTRDLAFGAENTSIVSFNQYTGWFSIPWEESDGTWSRWYNATRGRCVVMRPDTKSGITGAYLCQVTEDSTKIATMPLEEQKRVLVDTFQDVGWETDRVLKQLRSEDGTRFYMSEIAQTKCKSWVNGRVALLGDAGYCPAPISGQGTTLALIGAYVLAGCIATYSDPTEALKEYQKQVRPFVDSAQKLPPGVPWIVNPQSALGITIENYALWMVGLTISSGVAGVLGKLSRPFQGLFGKTLKLPDYPGLVSAEADKSTE